MNMTFDQYIANPIGKPNAILSNAVRETIRIDYTNRFNNILLRESGKIIFYLYKTKNNQFYAHIKIPSEVVSNFYYDTVIKFTASANVKDSGRSLDLYSVQFYSNDPAFVFTYAHTFMTNGLFIKELIPKMSKLAVKEKAREKNPLDINGYVKSIYFAYLFMKQRGLFHTIQFATAEDFTIDKLLSRIEDADTKIRKREEEGLKVSKKKKIVIDKTTSNRLGNYHLSGDTTGNLVTSTSKVKSVKQISSANSKMKFSKKTKKI